MLVVTFSSLLLLLCTINIHFVSGKGGSSCSRIKLLARVLEQQISQNLDPKQTSKTAFKTFKKEVNAVEKQKEACLAGAELEAQLVKLIGIMKDVDRVEKMKTRKVSGPTRTLLRSSPVEKWRDLKAIVRVTKTEAKLSALLSEQDKGLENGGEDLGGDYQGGFAAFIPIIQTALPIVLQILQGAMANAGQGGGAPGIGG